MAKSKKSKSSRSSNDAPKKEPGKQLTHFLCFPLLSDEILQEFGASLEYFRNVSTVPAREHTLRARERVEAERQLWEQTPDKANKDQNQTEIGPIATGEDDINSNKGEAGHATTVKAWKDSPSVPDDDPLGNTSKATEGKFEESLKVVPSIAHRPLGTYHLTIGVMNLKEPEDFKKAEDVFNSLNLTQLLKDAEKGPPAQSKAGRKWDDINRAEGDGEEKTKDEVAECIPPAQTDGAGALKSLDRPISPPTTSKTIMANTSKSSDQMNTTFTLATTFTTNPQPSTEAPPSPIHLSLLGLHTFPSPQNARVLFARPQEQHQAPHQTTDRLHNFALHIEGPFRAAGLITQTRPLTLHATLVNMRLAVQQSRGGRKKWDAGVVDARALCRVFNEFGGDVGFARRAEDGGRDEDDDEVGQRRDTVGTDNNSREFVWASDIPIDRVALCEMGAKRSEDLALGLVYPPVLERRIFG